MGKEENNEDTKDGDSIESGIFKDDKFNEDGFINYVKCVKKVENVKKGIKSIVNELNANTYNLNLIRESRIIYESKQNYGTINSMIFSILLPIGTFIFGQFWNDTSICLKLVILIIVLVVIECFVFYQYNKKLEEKSAAAYFWLETEIEKRIKDSKD